jgi:hypothetical protein
MRKYGAVISSVLPSGERRPGQGCDGNTIARPMFAQVMAQAPDRGSSDTWQHFSAGAILGSGRPGRRHSQKTMSA